MYDEWFGFITFGILVLVQNFFPSALMINDFILAAVQFDIKISWLVDFYAILQKRAVNKQKKNPQQYIFYLVLLQIGCLKII